jgi:hypothetical protein
MKYFVEENNSGGYYVCLPGHGAWVSIEAESEDAAIAQFEQHFEIDWEQQNTFEGGSCSCCGRRFSISRPEGTEPGTRKYTPRDTYEAGTDPTTQYASKSAYMGPLSRCPKGEKSHA